MQASTSNFDEGDIFITRHSNLSKCHLVFHIVTDQTDVTFKHHHGNKQQRVTSRHQVYQQIRYALRIASEHEVTSLAVPLLLTNDDVGDCDVTEYHQWAVRRAELVMKWMKGFFRNVDWTIFKFYFKTASESRKSGTIWLKSGKKEAFEKSLNFFPTI